MIPLFFTGRAGAKRETPLDLPEPVYERHRKVDVYHAAPALAAAVDVALLLGQPLVVTGEPGTGKTRLAYAVASELGLGDVLENFVRSTTTARDLFYTFDELARFRDSQPSGERRPLRDYISFHGLGLAIIHAGGPNAPLLSLAGEQLSDDAPLRVFADLYPGRAFKQTKPTRRLVLIDEMDKAPRDTPNDMLNEIERMRFDIPELGVRVEGLPGNRPVIIITSNSEKSLPDPFLRRCVYFDILFPRREDLLRIIYARLPALEERPNLVTDALELFERVRDPVHGIQKRPGTAELLAWLHLLAEREELRGHTALRAAPPELLDQLLSVLAKNSSDLAAVRDVVKRWRQPTT